MPIVSVYKEYRRVMKGRTPRPEWQDQRPRTAEMKDTYKIAAEHEKDFARAFTASMQDVLTRSVSADIKVAWKKKNASTMLSAISLLKPAEVRDSTAWDELRAKMAGAYRDVLQAGGEAEAKRLKEQLGAKLEFSTDLTPQEAEEVVAKKQTVPIVPVNPYAAEWMAGRAGWLINEGLTKDQIAMMRNLLGDLFRQGVRAEEAIDILRRNIGLTDAWSKAVRNRYEALLGQGVDPARADELTEKYREQLLVKRSIRIARTETIAAQAEGRNESWRLADDAGILPPVEREWSSAPESPNPTRPCVICLELDGQKVGLNESYNSSILGAVSMPPAHPHCRCTELLRRKKKG